MGLGPQRKDSKTFGTLTHPNTYMYSTAQCMHGVDEKRGLIMLALFCEMIIDSFLHLPKSLLLFGFHIRLLF